MSRPIIQSTAAIPPSERFAYWQDTILPHTALGTQKESETGLDGLLHLLAGLIDHQRSADAAADGALSLEAIRDLADGLIARRLCSPDLDVDAMVRGLGVSRTRLYAAFAERGGVQAAIRDARLDRVRAQLVAAAGPIKDIAFSSGFSDYASFARAFRRRFGNSPREYREDRRHGGVPFRESEKGVKRTSV